jgi:hypothetical protein
VKYVANSGATVDYQGHSAALHVNPWPLPFLPRGLTASDPLINDAPFWEIFNHARELGFALDRQRDNTAFDFGETKRAEDLTDLAKGCEAIE